MSSIPLSVRIGRVPDGVLIEVLGRMHPDARDFWDGNWLISPITVRADGFEATVQAGLRVDELSTFRDQVAQVLAGRSSTARLDSMEEWISLDVHRRGEALDIRGVVIDRLARRHQDRTARTGAVGVAQDPPGPGLVVVVIGGHPPHLLDTRSRTGVRTGQGFRGTCFG